jgi:hypothetical protein
VHGERKVEGGELFVEDSCEIVVADQALVAEGFEESEFLGFVALSFSFSVFKPSFDYCSLQQRLFIAYRASYGKSHLRNATSAAAHRPGRSFLTISKSQSCLTPSYSCCALSIMSRRRRGIRLEGKGAVSVDFVLKTLLSYGFRHYIDFTAEQPREALLKLLKLPERIEAATAKAVRQLHSNIDVGLGSSVTPRH